MIYCAECRKQIPNGSRFCLRCGTAQPQDRPPEYVRPEDINRKAQAFFGDGENPLQEVPSPCPDCYGERVLGEYYGLPAFVSPVGVELNVWKGQPKIKTDVSRRVLVCTVCGHITFYASDPKKLIQWRPDKPHNEKE